MVFKNPFTATTERPTLPHYYIGVDGGGTNCRVRLADAGLKTLAEARSGRANLQLAGGDPAYLSIIEGTNAAIAEAGLSPDILPETAACLGMAGGRLPTARADFASRAWPFARVSVYDDIDIACAGAHGGEDGAVLIIGTGSAGLAFVEGRRFQVGGWGFFAGDQMSGAVLGRELVRRAVEAEDGLAEASPLTGAVIEALGGSLFAVMDWSFAGRQPADYGALMPLFFAYLDRGDPVARALLAFEMEQIDRYVAYFRRVGAPRLAVVGGLGERLLPLIGARHGDFIVPARASPLDGALILASREPA